jgi:precorrin-6B methylase 1
VAGVSSIQASAARLNISWDSARFITFHEGTVAEEEKEELALAVKDGKNVLLLPSSKGLRPATYPLPAIKRRDKQTTVYVCENITLENRKNHQTTLADALNRHLAHSFMVIKSQ